MAKRNSRKMTANQRAYAKELQRIKRAVKRAEKRGYIFDESVIPQTPKRVTQKAIQELKQTKPKDLYSKANYVDTTTGEIVSGLEGRQREKQESTKKAQETKKRKTNKNKNNLPDGGSIVVDNVIDSFISRLSEPEPTFVPYTKASARNLERVLQEIRRSKTTLLSLTYSVIASEGKSALGWRLQENASDIEDLLRYVLFGSDADHVASACRELAEIIKGSPLTMSELTDIAEQEEANEGHEYPI